MAEQTERKSPKYDRGRVGRGDFFLVLSLCLCSFFFFFFGQGGGGFKSCLPPRRGTSHSSLCLAFLP